MATKKKTAVTVTAPQQKRSTKLEDNLQELRKILTIDALINGIDEEEALEFLDAIENDFATEKQELEEALKDAEAEIIDTKDFKSLLKAMKELPDQDIDADELIEVIEDVSPDALHDHVIGKGYMYIKVDSLVLRDKLEEFIKKEIYPFCSDQQKNMFM